MILLDPIKDGTEEDFTQEQLDKIHLRVLEQETRNAAVAKEYLAKNAKEIMQLKDYYFRGSPNTSVIFF